MSTPYTDLQLDALREMANIGSGTAGTALSEMIGRSIDVSVPSAQALPLADAIDAVGPPDATVTSVLIPVFGDFDAMVLMLFKPPDADVLCELLGVPPDSDMATSALGEIGNILGTSYVNSLCAMTGLELEPRPPQTVVDLLGAVVATVLAESIGDGDTALLVDSDLIVEDAACGLSFLLLPSAGGVEELLRRLGLG